MKLICSLTICSIAVIALLSCKKDIIIDNEKLYNFYYVNKTIKSIDFEIRKLESHNNSFFTIETGDSIKFQSFGIPVNGRIGDTVLIKFNDSINVSFVFEDQKGCCYYGKGVYDYNNYQNFTEEKIKTEENFSYYIDSLLFTQSE